MSDRLVSLLTELIADAQFEHRIVASYGDIQLDVRRWECSCGERYEGPCMVDYPLIADHQRDALAAAVAERLRVEFVERNKLQQVGWLNQGPRGQFWPMPSREKHDRFCGCVPVFRLVGVTEENQ